MMRVLHIMRYEKYVSTAIRLWDSMGVENRYVSIWEPTDSAYCELIDRIEHITEEELETIIHEESYDLVVFESLSASLFELIKSIPSNKIVIWQSIGADIYYDDYPYRAVVPIKIYKPRTQQYIQIEQSKQCTQKSKWERLYYSIAQIVHFHRSYLRSRAKKENERHHLQLQSEALRRIDYISTVLDMEYDLMRHDKDIQAKYFHFKYMGKPVDFDNRKIIDFPKTRYILLGNSSDASNNHMDILCLMKKRNIATPIYAPLAYAGTGSYPDYVAEIISGDKNNVVQRDFIAPKQYKQVLQSIRVGVFGHLRQQAMGNIFLMLMQGSKVFLYKDSIAYRHFEQLGAYVYTIEDDLYQENVDTPLTPEQIQYNRNLYVDDYNKISAAMRADLKEIETEIERRKNLKQ